MKYLLGFLLVSAVLAVEALAPTYHQININGNNYCLSKESLYTNSEAKTHCTAMGAELAMFDDNAEYYRVFQTMAGNSTLELDPWISFNYTIKNGVFSFYWKNEMFDANVWIPDGNPNENCQDGSTVDCCARYRFRSSGLTDRDCETNNYSFLCKVQCSSDVNNCDTTCGNPILTVKCLAGYVLDALGNSCQDVDECRTGTSGCQQTCVNSVGFFTCGCYVGYFLKTDNRTCVDINECNGNKTPCHQKCTNSVGSFQCSCFEGFTLKEDNRTCEDVNECLNSTSPCQQICNNTIGSFYCSCESGFTLSKNGVECIKLDECLVSRCERQCQNGSNSCLVDCLRKSQPCDHDCVNHTGTYECTCRPGYSLNTTSETACHDIDECSLNSSLCEVYCNNTPGSYHCFCLQGFHLSVDKYSCVKSTPQNYCPCSCSFNAKKLLVSKEQMTSYLTTLRKSLEVDKSNLLSTRLLVESQTDKRPSSNTIGCLGLMLVSIVFVLLILPDCITLATAVINKIKSYSRKTKI